MTVIKHVICMGGDKFVSGEGVGKPTDICNARHFDSFSSASYYQGEASKAGCDIKEWRYCVLEMTTHELARRF